MAWQKSSMEELARKLHLPEGTVLKPPMTIEDLRRYRDPDPEGAEEFVELIMSLRRKPPDRPSKF